MMKKKCVILKIKTIFSLNMLHRNRTPSFHQRGEFYLIMNVIKYKNSQNYSCVLNFKIIEKVP